ncbi:MAG: glycerophosphoryl diester phosphodiesterase membrane domain-containing protein [Candidatus Thorarchaeota archaeon]
MAFDELGKDSSQQFEQEYTFGATGVVSRTISVWIRQIGQYIIIFGIMTAAMNLISFLILIAIFERIGVLGTDLLSYFVNILTMTSLPDITLIAVSSLFAIVAFVINAILGGAAIKYALDDYNARRGDIRTSFSHSFGKTFKFIAVQLLISLFNAILLLPGTYFFLNAMQLIDISDPFNPIFPPGSLEMMMAGAGLMFVGGIILIYVSARFAVALAAVIDTDLSAFGSLKKSWNLTSGNVWHVIGSWILFGIVVVVLGVIVSSIGYYLKPYDVVIPTIVTSLLFGALNFIFTVVLYRDLSSRVKESSLEALMI